ncbi:MAG: NAD(+)/NADH kinase [Treponemataceae bacterium]|nr:NAD(+)/NADH kinase [Treponemataceae bacterium]
MEQPSEVRRVLLIVNLHKDDAQSLMKEIEASLTGKGIKVITCAFEGKPTSQPEGPCDVVFSLGGDGTVLYTARCVAPWQVPIFPINLGTLGFIAAIHRNEWFSVYTRWQEGKEGLSKRIMLSIKVFRKGSLVASHVALNDGVIAASGITKIVRLDVGTNSVRFGRYLSDGLIVATPTGSTAYSVAAGGPILDPEMEAFIINPICPFTLSNRPVVVPVFEHVSVHIEKEQRTNVILTIDGQIVVELEPEDMVLFEKAPYPALLVASGRDVFYTVLRTKLNWSGGPDA